MGVTRRQAVVGTAAAVAACATPHGGVPARPAPLIIAHRGASGERPEHTLNAYRLAIAQGADFIEPDLVLTKDGVLVCRHEPEISETTDVAARPEFAARRRIDNVDGEDVQGWFTHDFTLAELKTLRCKERLPALRPANTRFDGQDPIPTFDEVVRLAKEESARLGRMIGVYPETKHPRYFEQRGRSFDAPLLAALRHHDLDRADAPVFVQSFEVGNLRRLATLTKARLVQLVAAEGGPADLYGSSYAEMISDDGLARIARYAAGIGPQKTLIVPRDGQNRSLAPTDLVDRAHAAGLVVHPWTYRAENFFLPAERTSSADPAAFGDASGEIAQALALGVDGVFTDFPAIGVAARAQWSQPSP